MIKPEPMSRILIVSSRDQMRATIETLHNLKVADITEYVDATLPDFSIGRPLEESSKASERLVRVRGLLRNFGLEGSRPSKAFSIAEVESRVDQALADYETQVGDVTTKADRSRARLDALREEENQLLPIAELPLSLEDYTGYETVAVFTGSAAGDVAATVNGLGIEHDLFTTPKGTFALFVPVEKKDAVLESLFKIGFRETPVPEGRGRPADRLRAIASDRAALENEKLQADAKLETLGGKYGDFLLAAEEHLSIEVEKAEAPLGFATTENAFVIDAWVPATDVDRVRHALTAATGDAAHLEVIEAANDHRASHAESPTHGEHSTPDLTAEQADEPPTKLSHGKGIQPFQYFTHLFSTPRWDEIDPTTVLAFTFPLFFGFMIGDLGYGILMMLVGWGLLSKMKHIPDAKGLGMGILTAGIVASVFGGVVFHDAFGIAFEAHLDETGKAELAALPAAQQTCSWFQDHHKETTWACLFAGSSASLDVAGHHWYTFSKLGDVPDLLVISILVSVVHLGLGLLFGIRNELHHSKAHAAAKFGWLLFLAGFTFVILSQTAGISHRIAEPIWNGLEPMIASIGGLGILVGVLLGVGFAILVSTEGALAILEIPALFSNMLSYTRLAGVAVAKGAMAIAFNSLFLVGMVMEGGILLIVVGGLLVIITQMLVFGLGLLSSGIQAIRLNYVEFFTKFYKGGGRPFKPFGREREYTSV